MKFWVVSPSSSYDHAHLDSNISKGLACGLAANGQDVSVAWAGKARTVLGVDHVQYTQATVNAGDVVIIANPNIQDVVAKYGFYECKIKGQFTSCDHPAKDWSMFNFILTENQSELLQGKYPDSVVIPCLMGCPETIEIGASPYTRPTIFFCGRIAAYPPNHSDRLDVLFALAKMLPEFDFVIVSNYITLPSAVCPDVAKGHVIVIDPSSQTPIRYTESHPARAKQIHMPTDLATPMINKAIGSPNLRFAGAKVYGTFWEWYHYAWTCLDFGFKQTPPAPNTKVIDPLRAGSRIVAYGNSATFKLIEQYNAGCIVPFGNVEAMAKAIRNLPPETQKEKLERAEQFRKNEGWNARMKFVLSNLAEVLR